ncbi:hypothetical protein [Dyella sp. ASV21]|uniref:hypothetical protein n=1 Tax=Dyella sp. ASV21 TaxID=2795114 RepID=UPI0018EAD3F4|nr:hypothetical protein [Dyella sp. ASV21]
MAKALEYNGTDGNGYQPVGTGSGAIPPGPEDVGPQAESRTGNRILMADVILTLTREQAVDLSVALMYARNNKLVSRAERDDFIKLGELVDTQCRKQGVAV